MILSLPGARPSYEVVLLAHSCHTKYFVFMKNTLDAFVRNILYCQKFKRMNAPLAVAWRPSVSDIRLMRR